MDSSLYDHVPRVSIGLPVYNGERYLAETLESLLAQSFQDFELIISDNASVDATEAICQAFAARDHRVRYVRNDVNLGARANFNQVFELSTGEYFKWAAYDDLIEPTFISRCVQAMGEEPSAVLAFSRFKVIDAQGEVIGKQSVIDEQGMMVPGESWSSRICGPTPHDRLRQFLANMRGWQTIFGLIRSETLRQTRLFANYYGSDRALLMELSLHGCFVEIDEELFLHREHRQRSHYSKSWMEIIDPVRAGKTVPLFWETVLNNLRIVRVTPMTSVERIRCFAELLRRGTGRWRYWIRRLAADLQGAEGAFIAGSFEPSVNGMAGMSGPAAWTAGGEPSRSPESIDDMIPNRRGTAGD